MHTLSHHSQRLLRYKSSVIGAARNEMRRELSVTGKYRTKNGDSKVITRQPGGAVRGSRHILQQHADAEIRPLIDAVAGQARGLTHLGELLDARGVRTILGRAWKGTHFNFMMRRMARDHQLPVDDGDDAAAAASAPASPQLVYKWDMTNAINAHIAMAESFARSVMPDVVAAADGAQSLKDIARRLQERGVKTSRSKRWTNITVSLVIQRGVIIGLHDARVLFEKFIARNGHTGESVYSPRAQKHRDDSTQED